MYNSTGPTFSFINKKLNHCDGRNNSQKAKTSRDVRAEKKYPQVPTYRFMSVLFTRGRI